MPTLEDAIQALPVMLAADLAGGDQFIVRDVSAETVDTMTYDEFRAALDLRYGSPGAWIAWTPTVTSVTGSITAVGTRNCAYTLKGRTMHGRFLIPITTVGTAGGLMIVSLPTGAVPAHVASHGVGSYFEGNSGTCGNAIADASGSFYLVKPSGATVFTDGSGSTYRGYFTMELATLPS